MKPGSIVVVLPIPKGYVDNFTPYITWHPKDDGNTPYMVRELVERERDTYVFFEENVMGYTPDNKEIGISIRYVREILPPEEIQINQLVEEEVSFG